MKKKRKKFNKPLVERNNSEHSRRATKIKNSRKKLKELAKELVGKSFEESTNGK